MPSSDVLNVDSPPLGSQDAALSVLERGTGGKGNASTNSVVLNLDHLDQQLDYTDLLILKTIGKAGRIASKGIAGSVHLSRSAALERGKKLVKLNMAVAQTVDDTPSGVNPTIYFSLAPGIAVEAIEAAITEASAESEKTSRQETAPELSRSSESLPTSLVMETIAGLLEEIDEDVADCRDYLRRLQELGPADKAEVIEFWEKTLKLRSLLHSITRRQRS